MKLSRVRPPFGGGTGYLRLGQQVPFHPHEHDQLSFVPALPADVANPVPPAPDLRRMTARGTHR
jgi:hypothetical protein